MRKTNGRIAKTLYIFIIVLFLYSPIALLIFKSFNFEGDIFKFYKEFFTMSAAKEALKNSILIAIISACISTVIGTAAAVGISKYKNKTLKSTVMMVTNIPMTSPDIVTAVSLVLLFGMTLTLIGVKDFLGFYTLLIAHITFEIPYVILSVLPKIKQMDKNLPQAAMDLGCTPLKAFFKVELPVIRTGVFTGFFMAFTLSIDDFVISRFTAGSYNTLPLFIYSAARKGIPDYIYALSTIIFVVVFVVLILKNIIGERGSGERKRHTVASKGFKIIAAILTMVIIAGSCVVIFSTPEPKETLRVFNWGEYISDGEDDTLDVIAQFEEETGIDVEYITYANNEELYAMISNGGITYDIIVPSDYMFERLLKEGYLQKIDKSKISYYDNIYDTYKGIFEFDPNDDYSIPYTVGMVGVIYNTDVVKEKPAENWDLLWSEEYKNEILMFDNPRDAFAISQFKLGLDINSSNAADWEKASAELINQKKVLKRYVNDEIFDIMQEGKAAIATYYAGDFLTMKDENDALEFYYPRDEQGRLITNQFIDVMCITKDSTNVEQAHKFIDFMLRDDIALANAEYICYASPNKTVLENPDYSFTEDNDPYCHNILYPAELDGTKDFDSRLMFRSQSEDITNKMNFEWSSIKAHGGNTTGLYIVCGIIVLILIVMMVVKIITKRKRRIDDSYYNIK